MPKVKIKFSKWTILGHISGEVELEANTVEELILMKEKGFDSLELK
jgi:hypothetical protein